MKNLNLAILVTLLFALVGFGIPQSGDYIQWQENRPLKWSDFKARAPRSTPHAALTNSGIALDLSFRNGTYEIEIVAQFDKQKSWHKKEANSENLLRHEQLHFDISEFYARKLRKKLLTGRWKNSKAFEAALQSIYSENQNALSAFQDEYDHATEHSLKENEQKEWEAMIGDSLDLYNKYKGQNLTIKL